MNHRLNAEAFGGAGGAGWHAMTSPDLPESERPKRGAERPTPGLDEPWQTGGV